MYAAHAGAISSLQRYTMAGINLSQCNYDGRTPLHIAAAEGGWSCMCVLAVILQYNYSIGGMCTTWTARTIQLSST